MPSTVAFSPAEGSLMNAAALKLNADITSGGGVNAADFSKVQQDVENYYNVQESVRGYGSLAYSVVSDSDYNGAIAISNLQRFFGDTTYTSNELGVAVSLARADWSFITAGTYTGQSTLYVPTIADDDVIHQNGFASDDVRVGPRSC